MVVPADLYYGNYSIILTTSLMRSYFIYDSNVDVHINIIADDDGVVAVE